MKQLFTTMLFALLLTTSACFEGESDDQSGFKAVTITKADGYYAVTLDYRSGLSHREMGREYMKAILEIYPDYEAVSDSYLKEMDMIAQASPKFAKYSTMISRIAEIKPQIRNEYLEELEGMGSMLSGKADAAGDGKFSASELFALSLLPDLARGYSCSGLSVFGSKSATGETVTGRNLDFYPGSKMQMPSMNAIITIKSNSRSISLIGFLGNIAVVSAFNSNGLFAAVLDSPVNGAAIDCNGKNSYTLDLRYVLENYGTATEAAAYMTDESRQYTWNHNIILSDTTKSLVVENNFTVQSSTGAILQGKRAIRDSESLLNPNITWGIPDAIAVVNSNITKGTFDNHTGAEYSYNPGRWDSFLTLMGTAPAKLGSSDIKNIMGNHAGADVTRYIFRGLDYAKATKYTSVNIHSVIFTPKTKDLEIYFIPATGPVADAVYKKIAVDLN